MKTIMISGGFDPFTHVHLDYIRQAMDYGGFIQCVISSDRQLIMKKGKVNIPEKDRREILHLILEGLHVPHRAIVNIYDKDTTLIAKVVEAWRPNILCRGGDKTIKDMPEEERRACEENGVEIVYTEFRIDVHGSQMEIGKEL